MPLKLQHVVMLQMLCSAPPSMFASMSVLVGGAALVLTILAVYLNYDPFPELRHLPYASPLVKTGLWLHFQELRGREVTVIHELHLKLGPVLRLSRNAVSIAEDSAELRSIHTRTGLAKKSAAYEDLLITFHRPIFGLRNVQEHAKRRAGFGKAYTQSLNKFEIKVDSLAQTLTLVDGRVVDVIDIFWSPLVECNQKFIFGASQACSPLTSYEDICCRRGGEVIGHGSPVEILRLLSLLPVWLAQRLRARTRRTRGAAWVEQGCIAAAQSDKSNTPCGRIQQHLRKEMEDTSGTSQLSSEQELVLRERVHDEMVDQLTGGTDFPLSALVCALSLLARPEHQHWQMQIRKSGDEVVTAVVNETLRLFPPAAGSQPRELLRPVVLPNWARDFTLPPGVVVHAQPFTLHRNAGTFSSPECFLPERWLEGGTAKTSDLWAFGKGPTHCIAQEYSMKVTKTLLRAACERAQYNVLESSAFIPSQGLLLSPEGARVEVHLLPQTPQRDAK